MASWPRPQHRRQYALAENRQWTLLVEEVFWIESRGVVAVGIHTGDEIISGDPALVLSTGRDPVPVSEVFVEIHQAPGKVGLVVYGPDKGEVLSGDRIESNLLP